MRPNLHQDNIRPTFYVTHQLTEGIASNTQCYGSQLAHRPRAGKVLKRENRCGPRAGTAIRCQPATSPVW
jgi:hypothetical protein